MMTINKAEKITGWRLWEQPEGVLAVQEGDSVLFEPVVGETLSDTLQRFVDWNYKLVCIQVVVKQDSCCAFCGKRTALECDHIVMRSKEREDSIESLRALCHACHTKRHRHQIGGEYVIEDANLEENLVNA